MNTIELGSRSSSLATSKSFEAPSLGSSKAPSPNHSLSQPHRIDSLLGTKPFITPVEKPATPAHSFMRPNVIEHSLPKTVTSDHTPKAHRPSAEIKAYQPQKSELGRGHIKTEKLGLPSKSPISEMAKATSKESFKLDQAKTLWSNTKEINKLPKVEVPSKTVNLISNKTSARLAENRAHIPTKQPEVTVIGPPKATIPYKQPLFTQKSPNTIRLERDRQVRRVGVPENKDQYRPHQLNRSTLPLTESVTTLLNKTATQIMAERQAKLNNRPHSDNSDILHGELLPQIDQVQPARDIQTLKARVSEIAQATQTATKPEIKQLLKEYAKYTSQPETSPARRITGTQEQLKTILADRAKARQMVVELKQGVKVAHSLVNAGLDRNLATETILQTLDQVFSREGLTQTSPQALTTATERKNTYLSIEITGSKTQETVVQGMEEDELKYVIDKDAETARAEEGKEAVNIAFAKKQIKATDDEQVTITGRDIVAQLPDAPSYDMKSEINKKDDGSIPLLYETTIKELDKFENKEEALAAFNKLNQEIHPVKVDKAGRQVRVKDVKTVLNHEEFDIDELIDSVIL